MSDSLVWEKTSWARRAANAPNWPKFQRGPELLAIAITETELRARYGPPTEEGEDLLPGLGNVFHWGLTWPCGCEVGLWMMDPRGGLYPGPQYANLITNDPDERHCLHHLDQPSLGEIIWHAEAKSRPRDPDPWTLYRQDDNGGRFPMRTFDSRIAAECARRTYEARGHKQFYWIEPGAG